jgi:CBS domain-containing protein
LRVAEAMRTNIVKVEEGLSVAEASLSMYQRGEGFAIVSRQGKPIGIVTERDVTWKVAAKGLDPKNVKVAEIMSTPLITIDPNADLAEAAKVMKKHKIRRLAVVKEGAFNGILTVVDIVSSLESYMDREIRDILGYLSSPRYATQEG